MNAERWLAARNAANASMENGHPVADAIAEAIEAALSWVPDPIPLPWAALSHQGEYRPVGNPRTNNNIAMRMFPAPGVGPTRWSCGCDATECVLRRDQMQDAGIDPQGVVTFTCVSHGLVGRSHPGRVSVDMPRLDAQAMLNLDLAHQEQCR